ncbi:hypothetical protein [Epilithonimonas sp. UC225_85]|uniref:hypothetical protein n=1 Tax=Epilithonimonas sp. UC225_85 TaxID=3350167 RepID=UPI0036D3763C
MKDISDEIKNSLDNHKINLSNRLKIPVITTYCCVLTLFNWDIILYLIYNKAEILQRIIFVKEKFNNIYIRVGVPLLLAILYTALFPIIQIGINYCLSYFKNHNTNLIRKEELENAKHQFQIQQTITGTQTLQQLSNQIDSLAINNQKLLDENKEIINNNKELLEQVKNLKNNLSQMEINYIDASSTKENSIIIPNIIQKEIENTANKLWENYEELDDKTKSVFIEILKIAQMTNEWFSDSTIETKTIFPENTGLALTPFENLKLLESSYDPDIKVEYYKPTKLGKETFNYIINNYNIN